MLFENNLIYDSYNLANTVIFKEAGNNFVVRNNTFVSKHLAGDGRQWYEVAMAIAYAPNVTSGVTIANNIFVGSTLLNTADPNFFVIKNNIMYSYGWGTGLANWQATLADNIIYQGDSLSGHATNFEGSSNSSLVEQTLILTAILPLMVAILTMSILMLLINWL